MIPVYQEVLHHSPEDGRYGDCTRACLASLLELRLEQVPHFADPTQFEGAYVPHLQAWLQPMGLSMLFIGSPVDHYPQTCNDLRKAGMDAYHLLGGNSVRGFRHHAVGRFGRIVHDPWPAGDPARSVMLPDEDGLYELGFLVRRCA